MVVSEETTKNFIKQQDDDQVEKDIEEMADIWIFTEELVFDCKGRPDQGPVTITFFIDRRILCDEYTGNGFNPLLEIRIILGNVIVIQVVIISDCIDVEAESYKPEYNGQDEVL